MSTILPPLRFEEAIETTAIHSVAGLVEPDKEIVTRRPFRAPHHTVSEPGLVDGGEVPRPGEVSLAHQGVLFLDELAEFRRSALEALRQPLEDGAVCIARARARAWFPARPIVVGAVNPHPCGYHNHPSRECRCSSKRRAMYMARLSGPLLDRLDIHVGVPPVDIAALVARDRNESSRSVRERVVAARAVQVARACSGEVPARTNASLSQRELSKIARLDDRSRHAIEQAMHRLGLSARAYVKVLREHAFDPRYAETIGVDPHRLLISQPDYGEQGLGIAETLARSEAVNLVVLVAALVPKAEIDGDMGDNHVGLHARLMSQALRKITGIASRTHTSFLFINKRRQTGNAWISCWIS